MTEERLPSKFTFILHADIAGSTALVQQDEELAHKRIQDTFRRFDETITKYHGHVRELRGDALLAEFERASDAVTAALVFQADQSEYLTQLTDNILPFVRVGIAMGEVIIADDTITGEGVVLAQRVEQLAEPGNVCITGAIQEALPTRLPFDQGDLGEQQVKGFDNPVRVYTVGLKKGATLPDPATTSEMKRTSAVQWMMVAAVVVLICGGGLLAWYQPWAPDFEPVSPEAMVQPLPAKPSIAVLPFDDLSTGDDQGYLSDAISEGIITELSRFPELFVIARNSSFKYRGKATDVRDIATELGVHYLLEGSQQKNGDRLRVTVQLIDALAGNHIWAERYDRNLEDLFAVQDEIVGTVASTAGAKIAFRPPPTGGLARLSALHHHLKARQYQRQSTREGTEKARLENLAAIEADPMSAFGYIGLVFQYGRGYRWGWTDLEPEEALARALDAAEKALELDPNNYDAHFARGSIHIWAGEQNQAIMRYEKAIELNPSATNVMASLSLPLIYTGRVDEAIEILNRAMRLDPHHPDWFKWNLAWAQWIVRDCETALSTMQSMAKIPKMAHRTLATIYVCLGRQEEAEATIAKFLENEPDYTVAKAREYLQREWKDSVQLERWLGDLRTAGLPENPPLKLPDKPSIAVLPFTNMSDDAQQEYFVDGMTEDLITDLSKLSDLFVIARNSSFTYKGKAVDVKNVARDLGVRYVMEGSVRRAGNQVRINAQLIDATTGGHLWAERYDGSLDDIFSLQDQVTEKIVTALALKLTRDEQEQRAQTETDNPEAYDAFLKGWEHYRKQTPEHFAKARDYFDEAVELDPEYSRAYAALASIYWKSFYDEFYAVLNIDRNMARSLARENIDTAVKNPTPLAHQVAAYMRLWRGRYEEAATESEQAIALDPNDADSYVALTEVLIFDGRPQEALNAIAQARRLDPHNEAYHAFLSGLAEFGLEQFEAAANSLARALELNPELWVYDDELAREWCRACFPLVAAYAYLGQDEDANAIVQQLTKQWSGLNVNQEMYWWPFREAEDAERLAHGLRKAGIPETP